MSLPKQQTKLKHHNLKAASQQKLVKLNSKDNKRIKSNSNLLKLKINKKLKTQQVSINDQKKEQNIKLVMIHKLNHTQQMKNKRQRQRIKRYQSQNNSKNQNKMYKKNKRQGQSQKQQQQQSNNSSQQSLLSTQQQAQQRLPQLVNLKQLQLLQKLQLPINSLQSPSRHYGKILSKLLNQKQILCQNLFALRQKVELLHKKEQKKLSLISKEYHKYLPSKQYFMLKKQLNQKYFELKFYQKKTSKTKASLIIEHQFKTFINQLIQLEMQSQHQLVQLKTQYKINKKLIKQMKQYQGKSTRITKQCQQIDDQNKQLKTRIAITKKITNSQNYSQIEVHSYNIDMKQRQSKVKQLIKYQVEGGSRFDQRIQNQHQYQNRTKLSSLQRPRRLTTQTNIEHNQHRDNIISQMKSHKNNNLKQTTQIKVDQPFRKSINKFLRSKTQMLAKKQQQHDKPVQGRQYFKDQKVNQQLLAIQSVLPQKRQAQQELNDYLKTFTLLPNRTNPIPITPESLFQTQQSLRSQLQQLKSHSLQIHQSLNNPKITQFLLNNPFYKRQNATLLLSKEKDMILMKNNILMQEYQRRLKLKLHKIQELRRQHQLKKYQEKNIKQKKQQLIQQKQRIRLKIQNDKIMAKIKHQQYQKFLKQQQIKKYYANLKDKTVQSFQEYFIKQQLDEQKNIHVKTDYIGTIKDQHNFHFDDNLLTLTPQKGYFIREMSVMHNQIGIVQIKAKYQLGSTQSQKKQKHPILLSSQVPILLTGRMPLIPSIKLSTTSLTPIDYIKQIKLFYNTKQHFISKLHLLSRFNVKYQFGDRGLAFPNAFNTHFQSGNSINKYYKFDIQDHVIRKKKEKYEHYPSFMQGNYKKVNGQFMLSGLGFRINTKIVSDQ